MKKEKMTKRRAQTQKKEEIKQERRKTRREIIVFFELLRNIMSLSFVSFSQKNKFFVISFLIRLLFEIYIYIFWCFFFSLGIFFFSKKKEGFHNHSPILLSQNFFVEKLVGRKLLLLSFRICSLSTFSSLKKKSLSIPL